MSHMKGWSPASRGFLRRWALRFPDSRTLGSSTVIETNRSSGFAVHVAVPHWNAPDWCRSTVRSFQGQVGAKCGIVVVDNSASTAGPLELGEGVEVIRPAENLGYAGAANLVLTRWLAARTEDVIIVASHDAVVPPHTAHTLAAVLAQCPRAGIVGLGGGQPQKEATDRVRVTPKTWVSGTCLAIRRECAVSLRGFDEVLGTYDEDLDICLRAWDAGWRVLAVDGLRARTHGSITNDRTRRIARNHVVLAEKRRGLAGSAVEASIQLRRALVAALRSILPATTHPADLRREAWQRLRGAGGGLQATIAMRLSGAQRGTSSLRTTDVASRVDKI